MPDLDGLDMLREIKAVTPSPHVITITAFGSIDTAIRAVKLGAFDYITKPFDIDQLILSVEKALAERALRSEVARLRDEVQRSYRWGNIVGKSAPMQEMFGVIRRLSGSATSVLITGESGTGKELVAKAIHFNSPRRERPFVALNCAAIPDTLLESELFGHKRGAFTDARGDRAGHLRRGRRRHALPRRDRRAVARAAGQAPARAAGGRDPPARRGAQREDRRARHRRHQQGSRDAPHATAPSARISTTGSTSSQIHLPALRDRAEDILDAGGALPGAQRGQGGQGGARVSRDGAEGAARLRLAGQRARAGERRRARRRAVRERVWSSRGPAAPRARAPRHQRGRCSAPRWRAG